MCSEPVVLADGANVVVHLAPLPVVAKVASVTHAVRSPGDWLARELAVATWVASSGLPVVVPSPELPAVVHESSGAVMTFWRFSSLIPEVVPASVLGGMLRELHACLRSFPGSLPWLATPLGDVAAFLARGRLAAGDLAAVAAAFSRVRADLPGPAADDQALHGDAHPGNLLRTPSGWTWCDLEDACSGPIAWDLACVAGSTRVDGAAALEAYGGDVAPAFRELRRLHVTAWTCLYAETMPRHHAAAAELLQGWREG